MSPTSTTSIDPQFLTIEGLSIRCADSGGSSGTVVLLTSPWPESIYAFAPMWTTLAEHARLFAIDLPGFGASERRADLLAPRAMGDFLARVIDEADLGRLLIVAPDVGRRRRCSRRRRIRRTSPASSLAQAEQRCRSSSVNHSDPGCSTRISSSTAARIRTCS
jgi:hypothetical protein